MRSRRIISGMPHPGCSRRGRIGRREGPLRRAESRNSVTFHGRDVYSYTAARLAAGVIRFDQVGPLLPKQEVVMISYQRAVLADGVIRGAIPVLDVQYGNVWTNIPAELFKQLGVSFGGMLEVRVFHSG